MGFDEVRRMAPQPDCRPHVVWGGRQTTRSEDRPPADPSFFTLGYAACVPAALRYAVLCGLSSSRPEAGAACERSPGRPVDRTERSSCTLSKRTISAGLRNRVSSPAHGTLRDSGEHG